MKRLETVLVRALEVVFSICFLIMLTLIVTQVALRYGFRESIGGANELAAILFAYTSAFVIFFAFQTIEFLIFWYSLC